MMDETITRLDKFSAPYQREIALENVLHESGMRMLRIRIREGKRFTVMDIDKNTARYWAERMLDWAGSDVGSSA